HRGDDRPGRGAGPRARRDTAAAGARAHRPLALLLRRAEAASDRPGARPDGVTRVADPVAGAPDAAHEVAPPEGGELMIHHVVAKAATARREGRCTRSRCATRRRRCTTGSGGRKCSPTPSPTPRR